MNTSDYLLQNGQKNAIALISGKSQHTYGDLKDAVARVSGALTANNIGPGDRVGVLGVNSLFWTAAYLAIMKLGAIAVPFSVTTTPADLEKAQSFVQCKLFCIEKRYYRRLQKGLPQDLPLIFEDSLKKNLPPRGIRCRLLTTYSRTRCTFSLPAPPPAPEW
jgi:acyl-coenzyme A synthetase/AMP-(fatty) acid ligase